jgi:aminodeoxyfutalosine synthase
MSSLYAQSELKDLIKKVENDERLDSEAGVRMMNSQDILALGYMANLVCERKNGNHTYFIMTRQMNYTDAVIELPNQRDLSELHLIGEFNQELPFEHYLEILAKLKQSLPGVEIQAFTAYEIDYFTQMTKLSITEILEQLRHAGLNSLSGSRAEVFSGPEGTKLGVRNVSEQRYLEIQAAAHSLGIRTCATMFYGQGESAKDHIDHLLKLRELQDKTGGFLSFMPLSYFPVGTDQEEMMETGNSTGFEDLKMLAISRILLDNVDHIKAFWVVLGPKLTQVALAFGVDVIDSQVMAKRVLIHLIGKAGREAVERESLDHVNESE